MINGLQHLTDLQGETIKSRIYQSGEKIKGEYYQDSQNDEGSVKNELRNFIHKNPTILRLLGGTEWTGNTKQIKYLLSQRTVCFLTLLPQEVGRTECTSRFRKELYKFMDNRSISG